MKVRFSASASLDLSGILSYLLERNPRAAASVGAAIQTTIVRVAKFPQSAQMTDEPKVRMAPAGRYPYLARMKY